MRLWLLAFILLAMGCSVAALNSTGASPSEELRTVNGAVQGQAKSVTDSAKTIEAEANRGKQETPVAARPILNQRWDSILVESLNLHKAGTELKAVADQVKAIEQRVKSQEGQVKDLKGQLEKANSRHERLINQLHWIAALLVAASVALGVLLRDYRLSVAGIAAGASLWVFVSVIGVVSTMAMWIAVATIGVCTIWIGVEWMIRGSLRAALTTSPMQDLTDLRGNKG